MTNDKFTLATKPTKKALRELMNVWYAETKWKSHRFHNRTRLYGDYLYSQDPDMFNSNYLRWVRAGCPTNRQGFESA